jgi:peptidoglycan/xylan/chitin deacetylase (PgdA/CDA1 family)
MKGRLPEAVMYHYVRDADARPTVGYRGMDPATFEAQLDAICGLATPVGWDDLTAALSGRRALPPDAVVLTFDDGLADHHRVVLPRLAARRIPAIFFVLARDAADGLTLGHRLHVLLGASSAGDVRAAMIDRFQESDRRRYLALERGLRELHPSDPDDVWKRPLQRELASAAGPILTALIAEIIGPEADVAAELYLDARQRAELVAEGKTLGGHGRDHSWLDWVGPVAVARELEHSATLLAAHGPGPWPFAYPYGGVPRDAGTVLRSIGFGAAFTTRPGERTDRFHIGRHDGDEIGQGPMTARLGGAP